MEEVEAEDVEVAEEKGGIEERLLASSRRWNVHGDVVLSGDVRCCIARA